MALTRREKQARYRERLRVRLSTPSVVALAADQAVPDDMLDPFHRAVRDRLAHYTADQGGAENLSATKTQQIVSLVEAEVVLEPMTRDVQALARAGHLWSLRSRRAAPLLTEWVRLKEHRDRLLIAVGLERAKRPPMTLEQAVAEVIAARPKAPDGLLASIETATAPQDRSGAADGPETQARVEIAQQARHSRDDAAQESNAEDVPAF